MKFVTCPSCSRQLKYDPQPTVKRVRCPACQAELLLPATNHSGRITNQSSPQNPSGVNAENNSIPQWYLALATLALLLNLLFCALSFYAMKSTVAIWDGWTRPEQSKQFAHWSPWIWLGLLITYCVGLAGSIFLLMRRSWATWAFAFCTIAVFLLVASSTTRNFMQSILLMSLPNIPFIYFSFVTKRKGWIK